MDCIKCHSYHPSVLVCTAWQLIDMSCLHVMVVYSTRSGSSLIECKQYTMSYSPHQPGRCCRDGTVLLLDSITVFGIVRTAMDRFMVVSTAALHRLMLCARRIGLVARRYGGGPAIGREIIGAETTSGINSPAASCDIICPLMRTCATNVVMLLVHDIGKRELSVEVYPLSLVLYRTFPNGLLDSSSKMTLVRGEWPEIYTGTHAHLPA